MVRKMIVLFFVAVLFAACTPVQATEPAILVPTTPPASPTIAATVVPPTATATPIPTKTPPIVHLGMAYPAAAADGSRIVYWVPVPQMARRWRLCTMQEDGKEKCTPRVVHEDNVWLDTLVSSPDGTHAAYLVRTDLAPGQPRNYIAMVDVATGEVVNTLPHPVDDEFWYNLRWDANVLIYLVGTYVPDKGEVTEVHLWSPDSGEIVHLETIEGWAQYESAVGFRAYINANRVIFGGVRQPDVVIAVDFDYVVVLHPWLDEVAYSSADGVFIADVNVHKKVSTIPAEYLVYAPDARYLAFVPYNDGSVYVADLFTDEVALLVSVPRVLNLTFWGNRLLISMPDGTIEYLP